MLHVPAARSDLEDSVPWAHAANEESADSPRLGSLSVRSPSNGSLFEDDTTMFTRAAAIVLVGDDRNHARRIFDDLVREGRDVEFHELTGDPTVGLPAEVAHLAAVLRGRLGTRVPVTVLLFGDLQTRPPHDRQMVFGELQINVSRREVLAGGVRLHLSKSEFGLLLLLAGRPGHVLTRSEIIREFRGEDYPVTSRSVDVHIAGLRRKLGPLAGHLETVRGIGYRFIEVPAVGGTQRG